MSKVNILIKYLKVFFIAIWKPVENKINPIHLQVEPTNACNMNCKMCVRSKYSGSIFYLSFNIFKKLMDIIKPVKVNLTGNGESTLNKDIISMINLCRERGIYVYLNTNLLISKQMMEKLVESNISLIKISLDASTSKTYQKIRQNPFFKKILKNFKYLNKLRNIYTHSRTYIRINTVLMPENKDELCGILKMGKENKADVVVVKPLCFYGNVNEDKKYYKNFYSKYNIFKNAINYGDNIGMKNNIKEFYKEVKSISNGYYNKGKCLMPWISSYICSNGDVLPCCYLFNDSLNLPEGKNPVMGNINKQTWQEIWNGDKYQQLRKLIKMGERPYPACRTCYPPSLKLLVLNIHQFAKVLPRFFKFY